MSNALSLGFPLHLVARLLRGVLALGYRRGDGRTSALDHLPPALVPIGDAGLARGGNARNLLAKIPRGVHRKVSGLGRLAGDPVASLFLCDDHRDGRTRNRTDEKTGEEAAPAIALAHDLITP